MITPLKDDYTIDAEGFRENVRFILDSGYKTGKAVIMAATPPGEDVYLSLEERKTVMQLLAEEAGGKVPLVTSACDNSLATVIDLAKHAHDLGFTAIQLPAPFYHDTTPDEVFDWYQRVAKEVEIGISAYNTTWLGLLSGVGFQEAILERLSTIPNIVALKWSSPNMWTYIQIFDKFKNRFAIVDNAMKGLGAMYGAQAMLTITANFHPKRELEIWELMKTGRYAEGIELWKKLTLPYYLWLQAMKKQGINGEAPITKAPMKLAGRPAGPCKPPYDHKFTPEQLAWLKEVLIQGGVPGVK
jgi:dihydrodipicolinate synthase/N-acetylneuraminate lyase